MASRDGAVVAQRRSRDRALAAAFLSGAGGRIFTPAFGVLAVALATRALGDVRYGVVATLGSAMGLLIFADLGVGNAFMTRLAAAYGRNDDEEMRRIVSAAWAMLLVASAVVSIAGAVVAVLLPWRQILGAPELSRHEVQSAVLTTFGLFALAMPASMGARILMSLQRGAVANAWAVAASVLTPIAVAVSAAFDLPLWSFIVSSAGIPVLVSVVQTYWVFRRSHPELSPNRQSVDAVMLRSLLGVGGLFVTLNLASAVAYQADSLIVAGIQGAAAAAVFGVSLRVFRMIGGLAVNGSEQLWTIATEALTKGDREWLRSRFLNVIVMTAGALTIVCCVVVVVGRPLIRLWVGPSLVPPLTLLVCSAIWTVYSAVITQVIFLLNAANVVGPQVVMALAMALVNVVLSLYLTRKVGLVGPVLGSLLSHAVFYGGPAVIFARRILIPSTGNDGL